MLGVNTRKLFSGKEEAGERLKGSPNKGLKVIYISSPMKVTTTAAEFRATVQKLTGRDSDVARVMESRDWYCTRSPRPRTEDAPQHSNKSFGSSEGSGYCPDYLGSESPSESDSLFQDSTLLEVLGSFDSV